MTWKTQPRFDCLELSETPGALSYLCSGSGPSLVLIHGVGLRAESWAALVPALVGQFTVYAVDMPGHGGSPLMGAVGLDDYTARFSAFINSLEGPIYIAGHSMGAALALHLASLMPRKIRGIAALNAIYRRNDAAKGAVQARAAALRGATDPAPTLVRWFGSNPQGKMKDAALACGEWLRGVDPDGYASAYRFFASHDGPPDHALRQLNVPVLFMTGVRDLNSTPVMSQAMAELTPHGTACVSDDAAHMMPMTHSDEVCQALMEFFENRGAGDAD